MSYAAFVPLAALLILSALGVVLSRNPVRSAMSLVVTLFLLAVMFVLLDAHLVAALQIVVYAGAIMVLFLFVIMLLNLQQEPREEGRVAQRLAAWAAAGLVLVVMAVGLWRVLPGAPGPDAAGAVPEGFGSTVAVSERLFTHFLLPFEITSVLLLVAIVGAVVLAKRRLGESTMAVGVCVPVCVFPQRAGRSDAGPNPPLALSPPLPVCCIGALMIRGS